MNMDWVSCFGLRWTFCRANPSRYSGRSCDDDGVVDLVFAWWNQQVVDRLGTVTRRTSNDIVQLRWAWNRLKDKATSSVATKAGFPECHEGSSASRLESKECIRSPARTGIQDVNRAWPPTAKARCERFRHRGCLPCGRRSRLPPKDSAPQSASGGDPQTPGSHGRFASFAATVPPRRPRARPSGVCMPHWPGPRRGTTSGRSGVVLGLIGTVAEIGVENHARDGAGPVGSRQGLEATSWLAPSLFLTPQPWASQACDSHCQRSQIALAGQPVANANHENRHDQGNGP
jgi:hypothetical protein